MNNDAIATITLNHPTHGTFTCTSGALLATAMRVDARSLNLADLIAMIDAQVGEGEIDFSDLDFNEAMIILAYLNPIS